MPVTRIGCVAMTLVTIAVSFMTYMALTTSTPHPLRGVVLVLAVVYYIALLGFVVTLSTLALHEARVTLRDRLMSQPECRAGLDAWAQSVAALFARDAISTKDVYLERTLRRIRVWRPGNQQSQGRISDALRQEIIIEYKRKMTSAAGPWRTALLGACGTSVPLPQLSRHDIIKALGRLAST